MQNIGKFSIFSCHTKSTFRNYEKQKNFAFLAIRWKNQIKIWNMLAYMGLNDSVLRGILH